MKRYRNICLVVIAVIAVAAFAAVYFGGNGNDRGTTTTEISTENQLIKSVGSSDNLRVSPGEEVTLLIVAKNGAEVYVKWGANRYDAKKPEKKEEYSAYFAKIKMPDSA